MSKTPKLSKTEDEFLALGYSPSGARLAARAETALDERDAARRKRNSELVERYSPEGMARAVRAHWRNSRPVRSHIRRYTGYIVTDVRRSRNPEFPDTYVLDVMPRLHPKRMNTLFVVGKDEASRAVTDLTFGTRSLHEVRGY